MGRYEGAFKEWVLTEGVAAGAATSGTVSEKTVSIPSWPGKIDLAAVTGSVAATGSVAVAVPRAEAVSAAVRVAEPVLVPVPVPVPECPPRSSDRARVP